jgi:AI-2 transport protein TqsA
MTNQDPYFRRVLLTALWLGIVIAVFSLLAAGRSFLIPLVLAAIALYLTEIITSSLARIPRIGARMPEWLRRLLALILIVGAAMWMFSVVVDNASKITAAAPEYQKQLHELYRSTLAQFDIQEPDSLDDLFEKLNFRSILGGIASGMLSVVGDTSLVILYFLFLSLERTFIPIKIGRLFGSDAKREEFRKVWRQIDHDIRIYLGVKVFVSILVGVGGYIILNLVGVNFAAFWALLLFLFNFIPNIGSFIATALPSILALVQFGRFQEALTVVTLITIVQMLVGNVLEPQITGRSLNLSPFVALVSLVFWGMIWGIAGMLLCVPIAVVLMIVFSHFTTTRWLAVLLSKNGEIRGDEVVVEATRD